MPLRFWKSANCNHVSTAPFSMATVSKHVSPTVANHAVTTLNYATVEITLRISFYIAFVSFYIAIPFTFLVIHFTWLLGRFASLLQYFVLHRYFILHSYFMTVCCYHKKSPCYRSVLPFWHSIPSLYTEKSKKIQKQLILISSFFLGGGWESKLCEIYFQIHWCRVFINCWQFTVLYPWCPQLSCSFCIC